MYFIVYLIIFLIFAALPFWLQLILFFVSLFVAPGIGNILVIAAMVVGLFIKRKN
ncbi:MAG: hypothetical protein PUC73_09610 [Lachnospiraceae bacterium]|nr:hypothetical protein [Lachnospiraceae bacterium]